MTYTVSKEIRIRHDEDDWYFFFTVDEYGTVDVSVIDGNVSTSGIEIPSDCISDFINALSELK
jgi:hypothetical protein